MAYGNIYQAGFKSLGVQGIVYIDKLNYVPITGTVTDVDGNVYHEVTIGNQVWLLENLKTTKYNDGTPISFLNTDLDWEQMNNGDGYCWYNYDIANKAIYGALYKHYTVANGNLAPVGYHVATSDEWATLVTALGGASVAGGKLKETGITHWTDPNDADNSSGFTALGGGYRESNGTFAGLKDVGDFWTASDFGETTASSVEMFYLITSISLNTSSKHYGMSVRCVKDAVTVDPVKLTLLNNSLNISYKFTDWENPIVPLQCEFSILNEKSNFFELSPLMMAEEREYKIRVVVTSADVEIGSQRITEEDSSEEITEEDSAEFISEEDTPSNTEYTIFEGYLNCKPVSQKYLHYQTIDLTASNYLMKLEDLTVDSIDTLQNKTFIDIIIEILNSTGSEYSVKVNSVLHAEGDILLTGQTLFNKNGFFTELFWEDNIERVPSLDVLTTILKTFNCYIYWWKSYWYIERYADLWNEAVTYVVYDKSGTYTPSSAGTTVLQNYEIEDLNDLVFTEMSQTVKATPGIKTLKINLNDQRYLNMINGDLKEATLTSTPAPEPNIRQWLAWDQPADFYWDFKGIPHNDIKNAILRFVVGGFIDPHLGLYCKFRSTVVDKEDQITISYKYSYNPNFFYIGSHSLEDFTFKFNFYLRLLPDTDYFGLSGDNEWNIYFAGTEPSWIQTIEKKIDDFDADTHTVTINITIPIGNSKDYRTGTDKGYLRGDYEFVLGIGTETLWTGEDTDESPLVQEYVPFQAWVGDIEITTTGKDQDNVIEGKANTRYLNKLDINLDLYDTSTFDYKNAILRGTNLEKRTMNWGTIGGLTEIVQRGVVWSTTVGQPSVGLANCFHSEDGTGYGTFESQMVDLAEGTFYYYRAYAKDALGNYFYGDSLTLTTQSLTIGQKYEGGVIGYIFEPGDNGYVVGEIHGIIVAVEDQDTSVVWGRISGGGPYTCGATNSQIGKGDDMTALIEANVFQNDFAIRKIVDYFVSDGSGGFYTDWFLPTVQELCKLNIHRTLLGFAKAWYWTSNEQYGSWKLAWGVRMDRQDTTGSSYKKNNSMRTRACRYF